MISQEVKGYCSVCEARRC